MAYVLSPEIEVGELFEIEQLFDSPAQALAWMEEYIELVTLAKKPGTLEFIERLKLSLNSGDQESEAFATLSLVRLIEAQAAWLQARPAWTAFGRMEELKSAVADIRDSSTSDEEHEVIKTSFLEEHRKLLDQAEQSRPNAETVSKILADTAFRDWVNTQFKKDWNRALVARCGHDVERWVLVAPNSLKIMANTLKDLRRQYDAKLLRPSESRRQKVKNPGSAARRHPRTPKV
ncbi:MAG: hypothetical protein WCK71_03080 [bacterium]